MQFDPRAQRCIACDGPLEPFATKRAHQRDFAYDRCIRCGLVLVNPRPTLASLGDFYQHYSSAGAIPAARPTPPTPLPAQRAFIQRMLRLGGGPGRFLDVGSGLGQASAAAAGLGCAVTALEIEPAAVAATRLLDGVRVIETLFEDYDPCGDRFDYLFLSHVLEHAHNPRSFLDKAARAAAPGGLVWILLPNLDSLFRRLGGVRDPYFIPPTHLNHFNPSSLARLCRRVGLSVLESTDTFDLPRNVLSKRLPRGLGDVAEAATAALTQTLAVATRLTRSGMFVSCACRKA